jgi:hypothetical protein
MNYMRVTVRIDRLQMLKGLNFNLALNMEFVFVLDNLDSDLVLMLVIYGLANLAK